MRVIPLFRVSTERQASEGASLDAQERKYFELQAHNAWETVEVFRGSESAAKESRERLLFQEVLAAVRRHKPDAIYVHARTATGAVPRGKVLRQRPDGVAADTEVLPD